VRELLIIVQIITSTLLVAAIIVQTKGTGFGRSWGSGSSSFTRRGLEKLVFRATFVLAAIFIVVSILQLALS
jgi:preprotein translocase subunit SecG